MPSLLSSFPSLPRAIDTFLARQSLARDRLATGQRINRPADDPAAFHVALSLQSEIRIKRQAEANARDGIAYLDQLASGLRALAGQLSQALAHAAGGGQAGPAGNAAKEAAARLDRAIEALMGGGAGKFLMAGAETTAALSAGGPVLILGGDASPASRFDLGRELNLEPLAQAARGMAAGQRPLEEIRQAATRNLARVTAVRSRLARIASHLARAAGGLEEARQVITDADLAEETAQYLASGIRARAAASTFLHGLLIRQRAAELLLDPTA